MRFLYFTEAVASFASLASAGLIERQASASIYKFSSSAWIEGMATRSNGALLLNRLDVPELWNFDPSTKAASKLVSFTGVTSGAGILEIAPDVFIAVVGNFSTKSISNKAGSWGVWKVDLTGSTPNAEVLKMAPDSGFWCGITKYDNDTVLIADAGKGAIIKLSISTGDYSTLLADPLMKAPANAVVDEGIHGIKYSDGYVYFTNTFGNTFNKIKIDTTTGKTSGSVIPILAGLQGPEDFVIGPDGSAYIPELSKSVVIKVTADGKQSTVASASSCGTCSFGRGALDKSTLYISTSNGAVFSAAITS